VVGVGILKAVVCPRATASYKSGVKKNNERGKK